jgi:hypothetical protein
MSASPTFGPENNQGASMHSVVGKPEIGRWYGHLDKGEVFQVVGLDEEEGTVEMQFFGGDLDEVDLDSWDELPLALVETPEDETGPMDEFERDDLGYPDVEATAANWMQPPSPLGIPAWDDTRDGVAAEASEEANEEVEATSEMDINAARATEADKEI